MQVEVVNGLTGAEVARQILDQNGLQGIPVEPSPGGPLSDHYDPRKKSVHLSEPVYAGRAIARPRRSPRTRSGTRSSTRRPTPFRARSAMWPVVAFASNAWIFLLMIGAFAQIFGLVTLAIILYAVVVLFQLVTLPVEFDASRRAMSQLSGMGLVTKGEAQGALQGAHGGGDDVRRRRARRAVAARVLRARLPRQPQLAAPSCG